MAPAADPHPALLIGIGVWLLPRRLIGGALGSSCLPARFAADSLIFCDMCSRYSGSAHLALMASEIACLCSSLVYVLILSREQQRRQFGTILAKHAWGRRLVANLSRPTSWSALTAQHTHIEGVEFSY